MRFGRDNRQHYTAYYRDVRERSTGTFNRKRDAERAWRRAEAKVAEGRFIDVRSGRQTFERYVFGVSLADHPVEASTRQGYTYVINNHLLPAPVSRNQGPAAAAPAPADLDAG